MRRLVPDAFYWAKSDGHADGRTTVVQVSTVFGEHPDFWTLAVLGSDQHHMIGDFEIIALVEPISDFELRQAAE